MLLNIFILFKNNKVSVPKEKLLRVFSSSDEVSLRYVSMSPKC